MFELNTPNLLILIAVLAVIFFVLFAKSGKSKKNELSFRERKAEELEIKRARIAAKRRQETATPDTRDT